MSGDDKAFRRSVRIAGVGFWLASRASRNRSLLDRMARRVLGRLLGPVGGQDDMVLDNLAYDADELELYERGEIPDAVARPEVSMRR